MTLDKSQQVISDAWASLTSWAAGLPTDNQPATLNPIDVQASLGVCRENNQDNGGWTDDGNGTLTLTNVKVAFGSPAIQAASFPETGVVLPLGFSSLQVSGYFTSSG